MIIQHNMAADIANRQRNINVSNSAKNAERLASGYRVNRAADNAAGLSISEKMRSQVRGLHRASSNAWDGISLLRTADGALNESQAITHRLRELAVQAANDTNTLEDREAIQEELDDLIAEVDRVANDTEFNTIKLLDGSCEGTTTSGLTTVEDDADITWVMAQSNAASGVAATADTGNVLDLNQLKDTISTSILPQVTNAILGRFPALNTAAAAGKISSQIGFTMLESGGGSTLAYVTLSAGLSGGNLTKSLGLTVYTETLQAEADGSLTAASRTALEGTIAHEMMHAVMDDVLTAGMIGISADGSSFDRGNRFPSWFIEGMAQTMAGGFNPDNPWCSEYKDKSVSTIQSMVQSADRALSRSTGKSQYSTGYLACMYLGYMADGTGTVSANAIAGGLNTIFDKMMAGDNLNDTISDISGGKYSSYRDFERKFGDVESATFIRELAAAAGNGNGSVLTNNLAEHDAMIPDGTATSPYYNIVATPMSPATPGHLGGGGSGGGGAYGDALYLQIGANTKQDMSVSIADSRAEAIGLVNLSVLSHAEATEAIGKCDEALAKLSENRTQIGAYTNRLEYAIKNDDNAGENTQAAESLIRDTDMASEMVQFSKNNILGQASQSMLAQAMSTNESVVQLLQ